MKRGASAKVPIGGGFDVFIEGARARAPHASSAGDVTASHKFDYVN